MADNDADAKKKADEEAKKKADEEAKKKADEEAKKKADEEAKKKADEEARKKAEPIRTVCRIKRYYNNILYIPGQPGPTFHGAVPEDLEDSFVKA